MSLSLNSIAGLIGGSTVTALSSVLRLATAAVPSRLRLHGVGGTNYFDIVPPAGISGNWTMTLPNNDMPSGGYVDTGSGQAVVGLKGFTPGIGIGAKSGFEPETAGTGGSVVLAEPTGGGAAVARIRAGALAADRVVSLQDPGANCDLVATAGAQTLVGVKTLGAGGGLSLGGAGSLGITAGFFTGSGIATSGGAHTTPHGLGRIPTVFGVYLDGMPAGALAISAVSADATNINWTDSAAGGTVGIFAF